MAAYADCQTLQETYLFRAACSELRTEIQNTRRASDEKMRRERTLLQHEVDILNQKLTQELLSLKDELTGMFNDRKMAVRMEQREMDSAVRHQISYPSCCRVDFLIDESDPGTQLPDYSCSQQRLEIRSRGLAMDPYSSVRARHCFHGGDGPIVSSIRELSSA